MKTRVIRNGEGEILGSPLGCRDRFLVDSKDWGGNLAVVEHLLAPRAIAAPLHRHTKEDEFSLILVRKWNGDGRAAAPGGAGKGLQAWVVQAADSMVTR